jgi:hypothetical protein
MRTRILTTIAAFAVIAAIALSAVSLLRPARAQDAMMLHVCDSTLITLLYIAEHDYGFQSMDMDLATFDKGQYQPLFDAMMAMMMEEEAMATEEAMMEGEMMEMEMMEGMTMLTPGNIEGEDEACTALRAELDTFLYNTLSAEMMAMESGS